jgi:hypothetical protein
MAAKESTLGALHELIATEMMKRIESGEASPADFSAAIRFLKDNNITAMPTNNNPLGKMLDSLEKRLPFSDPKSPLMQ